MKPKKIRTLKDVELGKWYQSGSYIFQFIEDSTEGHLRGKILVNVEWSYKTQVSVPTKQSPVRHCGSVFAGKVTHTASGTKELLSSISIGS